MLQYMPHIVGKKMLEATFCRAMVCTILDKCNRTIALDISRAYIKCTSFFIIEDQTPKKQECRNQAYVSRKRIQSAYQVMTHGITYISNLKIMFWNCRGYPWDKGLGLNDLAQGIAVIFLAKTWGHDTKRIPKVDG